VFSHGNTTGGRLNAEKLKAALGLLVTTGDQKYAMVVKSLLPDIAEYFGQSAVMAIHAMPYMDKKYTSTMAKLVKEYRQQYTQMTSNNPYGVLITEGGWAGNGTILNMAIANYFLHKTYPDIFDAELVITALNYLYGPILIQTSHLYPT